MRVLVDKYIPFISGVLEPYMEVEMLSPDAFTKEVVQTADALIVRTRTHCDRALLEGSRVKFIATATIGFDHIDTDYCAENGIQLVSCPGCNAEAVCDYVRESLVDTFGVDGLHGKTLGVVGVGHVGSLVVAMAKAMGMEVILNDPPKGWNGDVRGADIITFHTPLTREGAYPTYHLCDEVFLRQLQQKEALIINAARGGIVDEVALLKSGHPYVIDCWEGEPMLNRSVLMAETCRLASYHIAGYSVKGKYNATAMCLSALSAAFRLPSLTPNEEVLPKGDSEPGWLRRITHQLRQCPGDFERLRKDYVLR